MAIVEKRPSTDGLVDNIDPRASNEMELDELPTYEKPAPEPAPLTLKDKLVTCFWIALNTISTLGLIYFSKRCALPCSPRHPPLGLHPAEHLATYK